MKFRVLIALLLLSLGFNAAGVVFLVGYLGARKDIKKLRGQHTAMEQKLILAAQATAHAQEDAQELRSVPPKLSAALEKEVAEHVVGRSFVSLRDGVEDQIGLLLPKVPNPAGCTLLVYFHGMGANFMQPFVTPTDGPAAMAFQNLDPDTCILSVSYRKEASWGTDAALADVSQNIRHVMQEVPCRRIVLAGGSMGACTALGYAIQCPDDIRQKITGLIAVQGAGDLAKLYRDTKLESVREAMTAAFGGSPDQNPAIYRAKSLLDNIEKLDPKVKIAVVSTDRDTIVPSALQFDVADQLSAKKYQVAHLRFAGDHHLPPSSAYVEAYRFVQSK